MNAAAHPLRWPGASARRVRAWLPLAAIAGAALAATLALSVVAPGRWSAPSLRIAVDTGAAVIALTATAIAVRDWRDGLRVDRLAIAAGMAVVALTFSVLAVAPGAGPGGEISITGTLVGAGLLAAGSLAPVRPAGAPRAAVLATGGITVAALAVAGGLVALVLDGDEIALQLAAAAALGLAAVAFTARGVRFDDAFARRLGLAVLFLACAKLHYVLLPPAPEWLHLGDVLRLVFGGMLLWAVVLDVSGAVAARAAERERRRIARDLHDGVAQELAFIRRRAARLDGQPDAEAIAGAAERALLDSRWAIEHLRRPADEPLERVLVDHALAVAARTGVSVTFSTSGTADPGPEVSEALARILGEAIANARHGHATRVRVELSTEPLRMRVVDDGTGFDTAAGSAGFGLTGMRERAELVGAQLSVRSGPGAGTEVAVEMR